MLSASKAKTCFSGGQNGELERRRQGRRSFEDRRLLPAPKGNQEADCPVGSSGPNKPWHLPYYFNVVAMVGRPCKSLFHGPHGQGEHP